jgi:hypothetical protein
MSRVFPAAIGVALLSLVGMSVSAIAAQAPAQAKPETVEGALVSVDAKAMTLTIKPDKGEEQRFQYNAETKVTGAQGGVAGLATMSGRRLTVQYSMQGANRVASAITIAPEAGQKPGATQKPDTTQRPQQ